MSGSDDGLDRSEMSEISRTLDSRPSGQRSNSSVHVCWHRLEFRNSQMIGLGVNVAGRPPWQLWTTSGPWKTSYLDTSSESSRTATVGRNSGWSSLTFVFIFTKLFKYDHKTPTELPCFYRKIQFSGRFSSSFPPITRLQCGHSRPKWQHLQRLCVQTPVQEPRLLLQGRESVHFWQVSYFVLLCPLLCLKLFQ